MHHLLEYAYTSRLDLSLENIQDVLSAASHVQMIDVINACSSFLEEQMDLDNCVDVATIAETYSLWQLRKKVYHFICANLLSFSHNSEFHRLSSNQLEFILECDYPVDCSEFEVLNIVLKWFQFNFNERRKYASLLRHIHFKEIPKDRLTIHWNLIEQITEKQIYLYRKIFLQKNYQTTENQNKCLVNSRGMECAIVNVGGFNGICGITNEITYYLENEKKWKYLSRVPHVEQCNFGCAVYNNELYVVGGCFNQSLEENVHPFGFRFNPLSNSLNGWSTIAPMQKERCRFTLTAVDNYLYAIGGAGENDFPLIEDEFASGEMYDPKNDIWIPINPMPGFNRSQHAAVAWNHYIFVSGGLDQDIVLNSMLKYNTLTDEWTNIDPMITPRADHTLVVHDDKIYVCGGWYEDEMTEMRILVGTIECYDLLTNSWSVVTNIPTPRYHAGIINKGPILYIIGGFLSDSIFDRASGIIESFNLMTHVWSTLDSYPQDIWEHSCCTLFVPKYRDDMEVINDKL